MLGGNRLINNGQLGVPWHHTQVAHDTCDMSPLETL